MYVDTQIQQTWVFPCRKRIHPQSCGYRRTPCNSGPEGTIWRFGDLEIDTVIESNHKGALVTINDRLTSKVWIRKLSGKDATPLALKTIEALQPIKDLIHTITADNGKEFAKHQEIAKELEISFYFCKPYHSWERGANENTNGLIRQYIPKGTDFSGITDEFVSWVENKLNNRPRKRLGYLTPNEKFNSILTN